MTGLPATARIDEGLLWLVALVVIVSIGVGSVVYAAVVERRRARAQTLTRDQVDRSRRIADARHQPDPLPWPLERRWEDLYPEDAEGEAIR